jgi:hypothetical protein
MDEQTLSIERANWKLERVLRDLQRVARDLQWCVEVAESNHGALAEFRDELAGREPASLRLVTH